jgi:hypothetical protein
LLSIDKLHFEWPILSGQDPKCRYNDNIYSFYTVTIFISIHADDKKKLEKLITTQFIIFSLKIY